MEEQSTSGQITNGFSSLGAEQVRELVAIREHHVVVSDEPGPVL